MRFSRTVVETPYDDGDCLDPCAGGIRRWRSDSCSTTRLAPFRGKYHFKCSNARAGLLEYRRQIPLMGQNIHCCASNRYHALYKSSVSLVCAPY